jgi:branched-chain amino acid transport system permease protein
MRLRSRLGYALFVAWVLLLAAMPFIASNYFVKIATFLAMYAALALSWNFIGGYTGYPSFSTAAFFGLGAYAGALMQNAGAWVGLAWLLAAAVVAVFAAVLGLAILRMRGHYFAIASIALGEVLMLIASIWAGVTGGGEGLNVKIMPGGPDYIGRVFLYTMLGIMLAAFATTVLVDRSSLGFGLRCIQQNEDAADMVGVDVTRYKATAFTLSAVFCGAVGAAYASWVAYISPSDSFSILLTLKVPVMVLLGGPGTIFGPIVGSAAFVMLEETIWAKYLDYHQAVLGIVIVVLIFFLPGGLLRLISRRKAA